MTNQNEIQICSNSFEDHETSQCEKFHHVPFCDHDIKHCHDCHDDYDCDCFIGY